MSDQSRLDHGTVRIDLGGDAPYVLKPTIAAALAISREYGGIVPALQRVRSLDIETVVRVICVAIDPKMSKGGQERVGEKVFEAGMLSLIVPVSEYLMRLNDPAGKQSGESDGDPGND